MPFHFQHIAKNISLQSTDNNVGNQSRFMLMENLFVLLIAAFFKQQEHLKLNYPISGIL